MISIPVWLYIIMVVMSVLGAIAILLIIFAYINLKMYESKKDKEISKIWDTKTKKEN